MAQTSGEDPLPIPQSRPSVESYSLPPGPGSNPKQNGLQGPVDAEIPLTAPTNVAPSTAPARAPSPVPAQSSSAAKPATTGSTPDRVQPPIKQAPLKPEVEEDISAPESGPPPAEPVDVPNENRETAGASVDSELPPTEAAAESVPEKATNDWMLLAFAALLFALLGALFLWRASRAKPQQAIVTEPDRASASPTGDAAEPTEFLQPAPAITIGFLPRSANTTLFNAVLGFELTLSNHGGEDLSDIRVSGTMVQADDHGARDSIAAGLSLLQAVPNLTTGETEKIVAEFRVPLAGIHPILFGSQALFVPLVQISIEFTDASGFQHFQTTAFLVGQEHQPPRPKMAPFRLDLGPRSFAPLGHRPFFAD
ncbi:LPXTG cell wall anchor domain-containing protein [Parasphingorhabdus sp. NYA22]